MTTHTTINGRTIEYAATKSESAFISRVAAAVTDRAVSDADLRALIYGPENPLLDQRAGYSFVTAAAFENPVFRVLLDLLDRKRAATGSLNVEQAAARYTLSINEAAEQLGISSSAVRTAVLEGRLPSWIKDGQVKLAPESVDSYAVSRRGRPPRLQVTCGSKEGASMRVRVIGGELDVTKKERGLVEGLIERWERVGVITGAKREGATTHRFWLLTPGGTEQRVELGPFHVVGRFTVTEQRNGKAANEAWHELG